MPNPIAKHQPGMSDHQSSAFAPPADFVDISGDGGVFKKILTEGVGEATPASQDNVFVHYTGTLYGGERDGEKFDSSRDRGEPFSFKLGAGQVIKGWDEAVKTMRSGEVCDIVLRSDYAYGKSGSGASIPPDAPLKFNIELLRWEGEDVSEAKDKGIVKSCLRKGEGYQKPGLGAMVTVSLVGKCEGREFDSRTGVSFEVGLADEAGLPQGVDQAVRSMTKGEKSAFTVSPAYSKAPNVPADATVVYEIELADFEKMKESWELNEEEKVAQAELLKAKGTEYFKKSKMRPALTYYNRVVDFLKDDSGFEDKPEELRNQRVALLLAARLNLSLVHFKLGDHRQCMEEADEAIKLNADSAKAYFRRGQARMAVHDYEEARADFEKVAQLEPGNQAALQQIALAKQRVVEERNKQKRTFYGMFDKFAKRDSAKTDGAGEAAKPADNGTGDDSADKPASAV